MVKSLHYYGVFRRQPITVDGTIGRLVGLWTREEKYPQRDTAVAGVYLRGTALRILPFRY
jgi:hypothetical protein